jgi:hypothetical protein
MAEAWGDLPDDELTDRWLAGSLGGAGIKHLDHVRIAWVLVRRHGREDAASELVAGTRRASTHYGVADRFDEALTRRWAEAVADAVELHPAAAFPEFIRACPELARADLLGRPAWLKGVTD